jgi:hypothetical protein
MLERVNAGLLLLGSSAMAQEGSARACVADIQAFCGEVQPSATCEGRFRDLFKSCRDRLATTALRERKRAWLTSRSKTAPSRSAATKS